ncbi:MAG: DUF6929 family protein [Gemmatimonadaceae bacterium]
MSPTPIVARRDPALAAVVVRRMPLAYEDMTDGRSITTPVRSASSIVRTRHGLVIAQDDANFIAFYNEDGTPSRAFALPPGEGGHRHFDGRRGKKKHKLDLEGAVAVTTDHGETLLQFGSGSTPRRESVAILGRVEPNPEVSLVHGPALFDALRRETGFAGSELNIEGAIQVGDWLRLFNRGNASRRGEGRPVNASCDLPLRALLAYLFDPTGAPPPTPANVVQYQLGELAGVALGFTDVTMRGDALYYAAAAEDSPDVVRDGPVPGSAIGVIEQDGARWAPFTHADGSVFAAKVEGLVPVQEEPDTFFVVVDSDSPDTQSELCTVELRGRWPG